MEEQNLRWILIGLNLFIFPPDPEVGDMEALMNWKPKKQGILYYRTDNLFMCLT